MAQTTKRDLVSDLAGNVLSGSGLTLDKILDAVTENAPALLGKKLKYPSLTSANWKNLMEKFRRNVPLKLTPKWVADNLNTSQKNAETVILPSLDLLGVTDANGKTTAKAKALGKQATYANQLSKILTATYPDELLTMNYGSTTADNKITSWFRSASGADSTEAKKMMSFYVFLRKEVDKESASSVSTQSSASKTKSSTSSGTSVTIRLDFSSKSQAQQFDALITQFAEDLHAKVEKL